MTVRTLGALSAALALAAGASAAGTPGDDNPLAGGPPVYPYRNILQSATASKDHTTLAAAVRAAGLAEVLEGPGPFTVFAPTNEAFAKLPAGQVEALLKPENRETLRRILTYHVVAGKMTAARIRSAIKAGGGVATLKTLEGEPLTASLYDDRIVLTDAHGGAANILVANVIQSNGLVDVIDAGLMP